MNCPDPALIAELVHGQAPTLDAVALQDHLADCSHCIDVVAAVVTASWVSEGERGDGTASTKSLNYGMAVIPPGTPLGRYRVQRWLGRGGMGEVYEGYDPELDRRVALKLLRTRTDGDAVAERRLGREAKTLARLSSPSVVAALDIGVFGGQLFLVMELVEGPTLAAWLVLKPRGWRGIVEMFLAAGEGLAAAHEVGVIHRDFKPQNVLIGADGKPRVSDFGLAREGDDTTAPDGGPRQAASLAEPEPLDASPGPRRATADATTEILVETAGRVGAGTAERPTGRSNLTRTGAVIGTPRYMAPEQYLRRPLDARVDQFAFCVSLYEALYGEHPFTRQSSSSGGLSAPASPVETLETLRTAVLTGRPPSAPRDAQAPRLVAAALLRGLARNPDDRYPTLRELLTTLRQSSANRRPRRLVAAVVVLGVVAGAGVATWRSLRRPESDVVEAVGVPADWSSARVLARVAETIHCIQRIDDETIRMIWGVPHQAEDIDVATGARRPTNLVPESYRHGCPTISPDHRQILFEGYDGEGRAQIFFAQNTSGQNAKPLVSSAEPTLSSEPLWLSNSHTFAFDMDLYHPALFDIQTKAFAIISDKDRWGPDSSSFFKAVGAGDRILVTENVGSRELRLSVYSWPDLGRSVAHTVAATTHRGWIFGPTSERLFGGGAGPFGDGIGMFEPGRRRYTHVASIPGREAWHLLALSTQLAFVSRQMTSKVFRRSDDGSERDVVKDQLAEYSNPSITPRGDILLSRARTSWYDVVLVHPADGTLSQVAAGPDDYRAAALPTGGWILGRGGGQGRGIFRCPDLYGRGSEGCTQISGSFAFALSASPDGQLVAFTTTEGQGIAVHMVGAATSVTWVLAHNTTPCRPVWAGPRKLWVSLRDHATATWTEFDVETRRPTGKSTKGTTMCFDSIQDPESPPDGPVRIATTTDWDLRIHPLP